MLGQVRASAVAVPYTHLRVQEKGLDIVWRVLLEKKKNKRHIERKGNGIKRENESEEKW